MATPGTSGGVPLAPQPEVDAITVNAQTGELIVDLNKVHRNPKDKSGSWLTLQFRLNPTYPLQLLTIHLPDTQKELSG